MLKKRLTERLAGGCASYVYDECKRCEDSGINHSDAVLEKLCTLEDMIEDGRLVVVPCKVGDTIWCIHPVTNDSSKVAECTVLSIEYPKVRYSFNEYGSTHKWACDIRDFGVTAFTDPDAAHQALKERESNTVAERTPTVEDLKSGQIAFEGDFKEQKSALDYKKKKKAWENGFQKWSNEQFGNEKDSYGVCGCGSMCDYCTDNTYGRPCVRALNAMCRDKFINLEYDKLTYEYAWCGIFNKSEEQQ